MQVYQLTKMERKNFSRAVNEIYLVTDYNHNQYQEYCKWFYGVNIPRVVNKQGEIFMALDGFTVAGLAILKNTEEEKKICTLLIQEEYRKKGFGKAFLEYSFDYLGTRKPLITIPEKNIEQFKSFIKEYEWEESKISKQYLSNEIIFNESTSK